MSLWTRLLGRQALPDAERRDRIERYRALIAPAPSQRLDAVRFVIVDVETSGLNPFRDRLIAIGALAIREGLVRLGDAFEVVLRQHQPSTPANILVHRIDGTAQVCGVDPAQGLLDFLEYAGKAPLVGYHADFDRVVLNRAAKQAVGVEPLNDWLDVARLAPALLRADVPVAATLDEWAGAYGIENAARHNAVADALVTAQLFQIVMASARLRGITTCGGLNSVARSQHSLERLEGRPF